MIICGYAGIGKSYLAHNFPNIIDLESTPFEKDWDRYYKCAKHYSDQGFLVLLSCHKEIRERVLAMPYEERITIFPCINDKELFRKRYEQRGNSEEFIKLQMDNWEKWTSENNRLLTEHLDDEEANNVNKVEPKFKVGNWYQCTKDFFGKGVTFDKDTAYYCAKEGCLQDEYGCHIAIVKDLYDNFKLWTIQDAKPGDVLVDVYGNIGIFEKHDDFDWTSYCSLGCNGGFRCFRVEHENDKAYPATKEQRDLLFSKMEEARYMWDSEKKELKNIEQNSAWSEEDDYNVQCLVAKVVSDIQNGNVGRNQELIDWLKSLKQRIGG